MQRKSFLVALAVLGLLPARSAPAQVATGEQEFQQLAAALRANDAERLSAIATCIEQGAGKNLAGIARLMGVPVERAPEAWCTRMTNGIASGKLRFADVDGLNQGTVTPGAREVLTTTSDGK